MMFEYVIFGYGKMFEVELMERMLTIWKTRHTPGIQRVFIHE